MSDELWDHTIRYRSFPAARLGCCTNSTNTDCNSLAEPHRHGHLFGCTWDQALLRGACCILRTSCGGACCSDAVPDPAEEEEDAPDDAGASPSVPAPPLRANGVPVPLPAAAAAAAATAALDSTDDSGVIPVPGAPAGLPPVPNPAPNVLEYVSSRETSPTLPPPAKCVAGSKKLR